VSGDAGDETVSVELGREGPPLFLFSGRMQHARVTSLV
jgi:hypothetical protein